MYVRILKYSNITVILLSCIVKIIMIERLVLYFSMEKFVKTFATVILFVVCAIFIIRCFMVSDKSTFSGLAVTDGMTAAYTANGAEDFVKTVDVVREIADDGYFSAYGFYYIPSAEQVQVGVRWNDSVYGYTDMPEGTEFEFELLNETTGVSYPAKTVDTKEKTIYNYRKLIIDGAAIGENDQITVVMKLRDGFTSTQVVRYAEQVLENYKLSGKEKKLLSGEA